MTTIFDLWSVISAFSHIFLNLYPQSELLDKTIREFAQKISPCEAILILDANSLVIGQFFKDEDAKLILSNSTPYFLTLNDSLEFNTKIANRMIVERGTKIFYFDQFQVEEELQLGGAKAE